MSIAEVLSLCAVVFSLALSGLVVAGEVARDLLDRWQTRGRRGSTGAVAMPIGFRVTNEPRVGHVRVIDVGRPPLD